MARDFGYRSTLAVCRLDDDPIDDRQYTNTVSVVSLGPARSRADSFIRMTRYVARVAKNVDVLNLYHLTWETLFIARLYKMLNPRGQCFMKLDWDARALERLHARPLPRRLRIMSALMKRGFVDFYTLETQYMLNEAKPFFNSLGVDLYLVPCGITPEPGLDIERVLRRKEKLVLTAGRLGIHQKHNELFLHAIEALPENLTRDWQFVLAGSLVGEIRHYVEELWERRADLRDRVVLSGFVSDRAAMADLYERARVFCLTSRYESFATVLVEAMYRGCFLVTTAVGAASELTDEGQLGSLYPPESLSALTAALQNALEGAADLDEHVRRGHERVRDRFTWTGACGVLAEQLERRR